MDFQEMLAQMLHAMETNFTLLEEFNQAIWENPLLRSRARSRYDNVSLKLNVQIAHIDTLLAHHIGEYSRDELYNIIKDLRRKVAALSHQNEILERENQDLDKANKNAIANIKRYYDKVSGEKAVLAEEKLKALERIEALARENEELKKSPADQSPLSQEKISRLQGLLDESERQVNGLTAKLRSAEDNYENAANFVETYRAKWQKANQENVSLANLLLSKNALINEKEAEITRLKEGLARLQAETQQTSQQKDAEIKLLRDQLAKLRSGKETGQEKEVEKPKAGAPIGGSKPGPGNPPPPPPPPPVRSGPKPEQRTAPFMLERSDMVMGESLEAMNDAMNRAAHIEPLISYLEQSDYQYADTYIRSLNRHLKALGKFASKLPAIEEMEEDLRSEEFTRKFFDVFNKNILSNMMVSIFHELKEKPEIFEPFLKLLNDYLGSFGIYTRFVEEGKPASDEDWEDMDPIPLHADKPELHNVVKTVELLPYYINYRNSDGEREVIHSSGKMLVYSKEV